MCSSFDSGLAAADHAGNSRLDVNDLDAKLLFYPLWPSKLPVVGIIFHVYVLSKPGQIVRNLRRHCED